MSTTAATNSLRGLPYTGPIQITSAYRKEGEVPEMTITTDRLKMRPISYEDITFYHERLYGNLETVEKYADGKTRDLEYIQTRVDRWVKRFMDGDYFSAFCIRLKDGTRVGHAILGHGDKAGEAEFAIMIDPKYWDNGIGKEAAYGMLHGLAPWMRETTRLVNMNEKDISETRLATVKATSRIDNYAHKIFTRLGFVVVGTDTKWDPDLQKDCERHIFEKSIEDLALDRILIEFDKRV